MLSLWTKRRNTSGFTLVELLTVISIIVILATLMIASFGYFKRRQAEDKTRMQVKLLENGLEQYKLDNGFYPPATLAADGTKRYRYDLVVAYSTNAPPSARPVTAYTAAVTPNSAA